MVRRPTTQHLQCRNRMCDRILECGNPLEDMQALLSSRQSLGDHELRLSQIVVRDEGRCAIRLVRMRWLV